MAAARGGRTLLGALGGMATAGILGLFVGATLLALGHQLFMSWVGTRDRDGVAAKRALRSDSAS